MSTPTRLISLSDILGSVVMRWLIVALVVSLSGLLLAAAGVARHVRQHRKKLKADQAGSNSLLVTIAEESDLESES